MLVATILRINLNEQGKNVQCDTSPKAQPAKPAVPEHPNEQLTRQIRRGHAKTTPQLKKLALTNIMFKISKMQELGLN